MESLQASKNMYAFFFLSLLWVRFSLVDSSSTFLLRWNTHRKQFLNKNKTKTTWSMLFLRPKKINDCFLDVFSIFKSLWWEKNTLL